MVAVTGANGNLGKLVVEGLLAIGPRDPIVALVRDKKKARASDLAGVQLREADYDRPDTLSQALEGVEKVLLISGTEQGKRVRQHKNVIEAAKQAGTKVIAYTSLLHADRSELLMAADHRATEKDLVKSGLTTIVLRNGWYLENHTGMLQKAVAKGIILGSAGDGLFASASRADYAGAAVAVLTQTGHEDRVYELAGDTAFTLAQLAAETAKQAGTPVSYQDLPADEYKAALRKAGMPATVVDLIVDCDVKARGGALDDSSHTLSRLLGRPTTALAEAIGTVLVQKQ